ncbi:Ti-type conjugative transfer relaxase TraA [Sinorhizobium sp. NFACC03]|nr:Ti-type conjugative transfer relaxase TraA [Sinorhizobium sp. NFACC03]
MRDQQTGISFNHGRRASELIHEELALPDQIPTWLKKAIDGQCVAKASEALWNAVDAWEKQANAQLARELTIALPKELTRAENITLVREFVRDNLSSKGMISDWVYHDKEGNPHIHILTALRPLTENGFGPKVVPVLGEDGSPLRIVRPVRPNGQIVYKRWAGDKETLKAWKINWAETVNRHLAVAGHEIRLDGRSYSEQGLDGIAQSRLGPAKSALARNGVEMYFAPAELARRQKIADRLLAEPELLLKQLGNEISTFDDKEIAKRLHRHVDDPVDFANIRARLMASDELVTLKPQQIDLNTGKVSEPAVFTTREILRIEYDMAQSVTQLSKCRGFGVSQSQVAAAIRLVETVDPERPLRLDRDQVEAVQHVTGDNGIAAVVGVAGAGKSTLLAAARIAWESGGHRVFGAALSGKAADGLEDSSGIRSRTLASWEVAWASGRDLPGRRDVLVVDEAGMVSSRQMARVLKTAGEAGAKIVLIGDAMQLQPINAGAAFRAISERICFAELAGVRRQRDKWARDASRHLARGEVAKGLEAYAAHGRVIEAETRAEIIDLIVSDWTDARKRVVEQSVSEGRGGLLGGDKLLVLAHTNNDVKRLNMALRQVMLEDGELSDSRAYQTVRGLRDIAAGERIIFLENARFIEPRAPLLGMQYVKNGMLGTVISTGDKRGDTLLSVRLDNGRDVVFSQESYRNVDHGYAATIHKSQGATVDRTFVLATDMMDQHLTYVSMTRHRNRADLYVAKEDFEAKPEWGRKPRVDHLAGVTGELLEEGATKFRSGDGDARRSPYADVMSQDGTVHRLWGVSLPKALRDAGASRGDTITLRKDGVETVKVRVAVVDKQTGDRRVEEREVERNIWTALKIGTGEAQLEHTSHRSDLFKQLTERLGRSGAKTTTLDFENEAGYQMQAQDFARRRGLYQLSLVAAKIEEGVSRPLAFIAEKRGQVAKLWERANVALGFAIERDRRVTYNDERTVPLYEAIAQPRCDLIPSMTVFVRSVDEDARHAQLSSPLWREREDILRPVLEKIYRDADAALSALNALASDATSEPRKLVEVLSAEPHRLGCLRGSVLLVDGRTARDERRAATTGLEALLPLVRAHVTAFRRNAEYFREREKMRRATMSVSIPAISKQAITRLEEIEAARRHGGGGAYKIAFAYAAEDRSLVQEVKAVSDALTARFGRSAFTQKSDAVAERNITERMPEQFADEHRRKLIRLFRVIRRFNDEQDLGERKDRSKIIARACVEVGTKSITVLPMLAAVTEFKSSVDDEARIRALAAVHYCQNRASFAEAAKRIWRDPAGALDKIEALILKGIAAERIAAALARDPVAYGTLRGSSRIVNRLLASGRERKEALCAVPEAAARLRLFGASWGSAFEAERQAVTQERGRMAVAIPGLSDAAEVALRQLVAHVKKEHENARPNVQKLTVAAALIDPAVRREFAAVSRALDARFGRNAILSGEKDVINRVAPAQRRAFEAMQERLKLLQQAVRIDDNHKIVSERREKTITRGRDVER